MLMQCLFVVCVLAVAIVGLLVMTRTISLEELGHRSGQGFFIALMVLIALGVVKGFLLPISSGVVALKHAAGWLVIIVLAIVAAMLLLRMLVSDFQKWLSPKDGHDRGEL